MKRQSRPGRPLPLWLPDPNNRRWRMLTAARVFVLAAGLGFAAAAGTVPESATTFLALCMVAALMCAPALANSAQSWAPIGEGALAALILGAAGDYATSLMVYLAVPPLAAGLLAGRRHVVATVAAESAAQAAGLFASHVLSSWAMLLEAGPWMLLGIGSGLLGAAVKDRLSVGDADKAGYESAHRLLAQLRAISRRLSAGLDTASLAQHTLAECVERLGATRAVLLASTAGGSLVPLAGYGDVSLYDVSQDDAAVAECWSTGSSLQRTTEGPGASRNRVALPLHVGTRTMGVILADTSAPVPSRNLSRLQSMLAEHSLRLESALLFEEIRSIATTEERHRLAREIHDGVAQEVASLGYLVDEIGAYTTDEGRQVVHQLRSELSRIVSDLRLSIFDLRTGVNPNGGLGLALSDYAREVGGRAGMTVHLALAERPQRLPANIETELLRIAQEAITNARKHSRAHNLWVTLNTESPVALLRIEDDGIGSIELRADHYGLRIMRERAQRINAELAISPRPRGGTSVVVAIPPTLDKPGEPRVDQYLAR